MKKKILVSLSGGMDSTTVLAAVMEQEHQQQIKAVSFTYGSKHNQFENEAAEKIAAHYGIPLQKIDISSIMSNVKSDLLLSGGEIPEGHYQAETMRQTVVPGRNIIFCSILAGIAMSEGASEVWLGVHSGDHHIYPDCRPDFVRHMAEAVFHGTGEKVFLTAPYLYINKMDILKRGMAMKVPYHLTRTCYKNQPIACGKCGSCRERLEAFERLEISDPLAYEEDNG